MNGAATLLSNLLAPASSPTVPRVAIVMEIEGRVDVKVACRSSERRRLLDDVLADPRRAALIDLAVELAEGDDE